MNYPCHDEDEVRILVRFFCKLIGFATLNIDSGIKQGYIQFSTTFKVII